MKKIAINHPRSFAVFAIAAVVAAQPLHGATFTFDETSGTHTWNGTWSPSNPPNDDATTALIFGDGTSLAAGASVTANNDLGVGFDVNSITFNYAGPASGTAPSVTSGGQSLEFRNNGSTNPFILVDNTGTVKPNATISNWFTATAPLTITTNSDLRIQGRISGTSAGPIVKTGSGNLTLANTGNEYAGTTTISAGTLIVASGGTINSSGGFLVETNGTLDVTANASGLTVGAGKFVGGNGTISGNLTLASGALFAFDPANTLTLNGTFSLDSTFGVASLRDLSGGALDWGTIADNTYTLMDTSFVFDATNISNFGLANAFNIGGGRSAYFESGSLDLVVIPEPSTWALLAGSLTALVIFRRRRRTA